ncbi:hypothetical protein FTV88_1246 [Heliorestis convoluta]|uniref:Uncharacterized protein n=1 Tax=Heliorestis convoluta TaxID=356322 RepID=A0A5Q2N0U3_9FIRM|nr:hypothetical protein FTV88_1246 [Heliorestis convoluta]
MYKFSIIKSRKKKMAQPAITVAGKSHLFRTNVSSPAISAAGKETLSLI